MQHTCKQGLIKQLAMTKKLIQSHSQVTRPKSTGAKLYSQPSTLKNTGANVPIAPMASAPPTMETIVNGRS